MELGIKTAPKPERYTIAVTGEIDISNADHLRNAVDMAFEQPTERVELDLAEVSYIDSTGIGVLVGAATRAAEGHVAFKVANPQANVRRVLGLLGVEQQLHLED